MKTAMMAKTLHWNTDQNLSKAPELRVRDLGKRVGPK